MTSTPASYATPAPERPDDQLLNIGKQCSEATCNLVDFLPFKCEHCKQSFCQEHFKVEAHRCPEYDESKHDRVAPNCPQCNTPVAIPPGEDPNIRMNAHLTNECTVSTGGTKAKSSPACAKGSCKKYLYKSFPCDNCQKQFCNLHYHQRDHNCPALVQPPRDSTSKAVRSRLLHEASAATMAVKNGVSTAFANTKVRAPPVTKSNSSGTNSSNSAGNNPFSKKDRRAKAERQSRVQAMRERGRKGLLSQDEQKILAEEEAALKADKDCLVM